MCGHNKTSGTAKVALGQLCNSIDTFAKKSFKMLESEHNKDTLLFGAFCARVILENACAALVGRLDTFRILYLSEFQSQSEYEAGKRARSSFAWSGDVIPEEKPSGSLWSIDNDIPKISRALFSKHAHHMYWRPALERTFDYISTNQTDPLFASLLSYDPDSYIDVIKGKSSQLYSSLSKGVHWEYFTTALTVDENTIKTSIKDTLQLVSDLGYISHFIPTAYASLEPQKASQIYLELRRKIN